MRDGGTPAEFERAPQRVRAAIYSRVSTDEGLHQEFNSLHAQRESCEAFIASQRHEGWITVPTHYGDGGYSGGTLARPALQRLLSDVAAGHVDIIVVYKIDRLSRSLTDFSKIVEVLDKASASFVSITQSFNTTSSMGRLTLNVLLSFAQFEREVGAERIRDKIAASKKRGLWMGGNPPLGYDPENRRLTVNEREAATVRKIFELYVKLGSVLKLQGKLRTLGVVSKVRQRTGREPVGGKPFTRGALYALLQNRIYIGQICHHGQAYPGQHDPIIQDELFERAQSILSSNRAERRVRFSRDEIAILAGLVWDAHGRRLSPTHTKKGPSRYRYYATKPEVDALPSTRVAAADLETVVKTWMVGFLRSRRQLHDLIEIYEPDAIELEALFHAAEVASDTLKGDRRSAHATYSQNWSSPFEC